VLDAVERLCREQALNLILPASATTGAAFFSGAHGFLRRFESLKGKAGTPWPTPTWRWPPADRDRGGGAFGNPHGDVLQSDAAELAGGKLLVRVPFYSMVT